MLEHGGRLRLAAQRYGIPLADWVDLSTGINPQAWPVPRCRRKCWQRLPETDDGLEAAAAAYYGSTQLLPVAGSQAAIQWLPTALLPQAVGRLHFAALQRASARLAAGRAQAALPAERHAAARWPGDAYVLLCNPNNPTADRHPHESLLDAARS
jgi:cobalamin biosynthetic protein CobC